MAWTACFHGVRDDFNILHAATSHNNPHSPQPSSGSDPHRNPIKYGRNPPSSPCAPIRPTPRLAPSLTPPRPSRVSTSLSLTPTKSAIRTARLKIVSLGIGVEKYSKGSYGSHGKGFCCQVGWDRRSVLCRCARGFEVSASGRDGVSVHATGADW